jgi:hypothetical protein
MSKRARHVTSLLALGAIAVIAALFVGGISSKPAAAPPCGRATAATYEASALGVALRVAAGERGGGAVRRALHTIESDDVLARAVAAGDATAVHAELLVLLYNHEHIVRMRVLSHGHLIDDLGGPLVLAPVGGSLRVGGRAVGTFLMSIQDDLGYRLLLSRLTGAHTVMTYGGRVLMRDIAVSTQRLSSGAVVTVGDASYLVSEVTVGHFPRGQLRVFMLVHSPPASLARLTCAQVTADALAGIARRAYDEALSGQQIVHALGALADASALRAALAAGDYATAARAVRELVAAGGFARLRVFTRGHLVAEAGSARALLAPVTLPLTDASGRVYGQAVFTVQSAHGYADLAHSLTDVPVLVRSGRRQLAGTFRGPPSLPNTGALLYNGVSYRVASFAGELFPSGPLRVYVLNPQRS